MSDELIGVLPWCKSCFVCGQNNPQGLNVRVRAEGKLVVVEYRTQEKDLGYRHLTHGGILMTLADEVMGWASIIALRKMSVAAEVTSRFSAPVGLGQLIRVEGWSDKVNSRICFTSCVISNVDSGQTLIKCSGKYVPMPSNNNADYFSDFVFSPDSIPLNAILGD